MCNAMLPGVMADFSRAALSASPPFGNGAQIGDQLSIGIGVVIVYSTGRELGLMRFQPYTSHKHYI